MNATFRNLIKALPMLILMLFPTAAKTATATATVTANIVALASTSLSGGIVISNLSHATNKLPSTGNNKPKNSGSVILSTDGMNKAKHMVKSRNLTYDVTLTSNALIKDTAGHDIAVDRLQLTSNTNQSKETNELVHYIDGAFTLRSFASINPDDGTIKIPTIKNTRTEPDPYENAISLTVHFN